MDDDPTLTLAIAENLLAIAQSLAPHLAALGDDDASREALLRRLDEALTPEWALLDATEALQDLHYGTALAMFGVDRLAVPR